MQTKGRKEKHGMWKSKEYNSWDHMKRRCLNPNDPKYYRYGARGITVCARWLGDNGFQNFFNDMGFAPSPSHSIDRIDNDGNYEPANCKWSTPKEQANNTSRNRKAA